MNRETIEKKADNYSAEIMPAYSDGYFEKYQLADAFETGAHWRINSVWHNTCDIAEPGKDCLVEHMDGDGNVCICIDWRSEYEWVNACHYDKILRWAYISDLLPERKEDGR